MAERNGAPTRTKKREKKNVPVGHAHIQSTFNNTIVTITDTTGNVISWGSAGLGRLQGLAQEHALRGRPDGRSRREARMENGMRQIEVFVKGPGAGREQAIRSLQTAGLEVTAITDVTPIPHNGCRPPKRRRV